MYADWFRFRFLRAEVWRRFGEIWRNREDGKDDVLSDGKRVRARSRMAGEIVVALDPDP